MITTSHETNEPVSYQNAPRRVDSDGIIRVELDASLELTRRIAAREKELLESLATK